MHERHQREGAVLTRAIRSEDQQAVETESVAGPVGEALLGAPVDLAQFGPGVGELGERALRRSGEDVSGAGAVLTSAATGPPRGWTPAK